MIYIIKGGFFKRIGVTHDGLCAVRCMSVLARGNEHDHGLIVQDFRTILGQGLLDTELRASIEAFLAEYSVQYGAKGSHTLDSKFWLTSDHCKSILLHFTFTFTCVFLNLYIMYS